MSVLHVLRHRIGVQVLPPCDKLHPVSSLYITWRFHAMRPTTKFDGSMGDRSHSISSDFRDWTTDVDAFWVTVAQEKGKPLAKQSSWQQSINGDCAVMSPTCSKLTSPGPNLSSYCKYPIGQRFHRIEHQNQGNAACTIFLASLET